MVVVVVVVVVVDLSLVYESYGCDYCISAVSIFSSS
jgi:hypothetical protein